MQFEVTEWKENEKLAIRMISGGSYKSYEQHFAVEPAPSGSRVSFMEEIILPFGVLGKLIGVIAQGMSNASVDKMFAKLKVLAEA